MSTLNTTNIKHPSSGSNNIVLASDGTTTIAAPSNIIKSGTSVASTSGTSIDFTGIPSWVKRITVMFNGVSLSGTTNFLVQLGDSGGIETTGYESVIFGYGQHATSTSGLIFWHALASRVSSGHVHLTLLSGNSWIGSVAVANWDANTANVGAHVGGMRKTLSDTLDRIRITTVNGTDTFDAGTINILYEG